jgi:hypothetical protein
VLETVDAFETVESGRAFAVPIGMVWDVMESRRAGGVKTPESEVDRECALKRNP